MDLVSSQGVATTHDIYIVRITAVATLTCLVYDYLLTLSEERRLVWPSRMSAIKVAFFLNRYMSLVSVAGSTYVLLSVETSVHFNTCRPLFLLFAFMASAEYCVAQFILYVRAYAVWGCNRSVLIVIGIVYMTCVIAGLCFAIPFLKSATALNLRIFPIGCTFHLEGPADKPPFMILIFSESFALVVLMIKSIQMSKSTMMLRILSDGVLYFVVIICFSIANIFALGFSPMSSFDLLINPQTALHSICCSRLLLRIRGAYSPLTPAGSRAEYVHDADNFDANNINGGIELHSVHQLETLEFASPTRSTYTTQSVD